MIYNTNIEILNIFSGESQEYLRTDDFYKILNSEVYCKNDSQYDEVKQNYWRFELKNNNADNGCKKEIRNFYKKIIRSRKDSILKSHQELNMIFYTWYEMGEFCFSITQKKWGKLPFDCLVNYSNSLDDIIDEFIQDPYVNGIPIGNFIEIDDVSDNQDIDKTSINLFVVTL